MQTSRWMPAAIVGLVVTMAGCAEPKRETTLHEAVNRGDIKAATELLDAGADVNVRDEGGATPLHAAAFRGDVEMAKLLISKDADINASDRDGDTPLNFATEEDMMRELERAGAKRK